MTRGNVQKWSAEGTTPNILFRNGWNKDSLKPGDQLKEVSGNHCKNGNHCMRLRKIVLANGQELPIPQQIPVHRAGSDCPWEKCS